MEPGIDGPLHFGINIGQAADLAVSPPVKYRDRRVPQDRLHENIYSPVKKVFYMLPYNALHYTGIHKVAHFLTEDPDLLIDTAAVGQASGNGIFRLRPGDHDGFGESFPAPVPERRHPGDTSCQEQQFRDLAVQFFADLAQAGRENFMERPPVQLRSRGFEEVLCHFFIHFELKSRKAVLFFPKEPAQNAGRACPEAPPPFVPVSFLLFRFVPVPAAFYEAPR